jgi:hypothetical protein
MVIIGRRGDQAGISHMEMSAAALPKCLPMRHALHSQLFPEVSGKGWGRCAEVHCILDFVGNMPFPAKTRAASSRSERHARYSLHSSHLEFDHGRFQIFFVLLTAYSWVDIELIPRPGFHLFFGPRIHFHPERPFLRGFSF